MPIFRKGLSPYALAEAMTGVRLGERLLYVGAGDPAIFAALAAKAGLTGRARAAVESEAALERVQQAAARAGILVEVAVAALPQLDAEAGAFDVGVVDATGGAVLQLSPDQRAELGREMRRCLRPRGRAIVIEREARGLAAAFRGRVPGAEQFRAQEAANQLLLAAGFHPVRLLADRDGQRFTEGWKPPEVG